MDFLPINIRISDAHILMVGGGRVATHKATILSRYTTEVTVIAPEISDGIKALPFRWIERPFEPTDLDGTTLLFVCTGDHSLNREIRRQARKRGILTSVCDAPADCDFTSPAIYRDGDLTISVASDGKDVHRSIAVRNNIAALAASGQLSISNHPTSIIDTPPRPTPQVTLVGFGPGDPELLTVKAVRTLEQADIIFHDDLINKAYLHTLTAEKVYVGKRSGHHAAEQADINRHLLEAALQGKRVVRLKGGDPMLFAHAQEEIDYLRNHGVKVNVIPGITTASALAARTLTSLTERGVSQSVALVNGHANRPLTPDAETLVYYMGASKLQQIAQSLISKGKRRATPVLLGANVSQSNELMYHTTLEQLASETPDYPTPLIALVGEVARKRT